MAKLYWITGLSGAGKTTIGRKFYERLRQDDPAVVFLDGDSLRKAFGGDLGYSEEDRRKCARRYSEIGKLLTEQGITVVLCTISMFHEVREWNRKNIEGYTEIYVKVSMDTLKSRDQKGLYSRTSLEKDTTVSGVDFKFEEPKNPDYIIDNEGNRDSQVIVDELYEKMYNNL